MFGVTHFFVFIYIVVYPFTLWFTPLYLLLKNDKKAMKNLAWGLLLIYIFALPFYLLLPITNVYTFYNIDSALETAIPGIEQFFYNATTYNNCLPSLHTAVSILIAYVGGFTGNKKYALFTKTCMILVITAVIYLSIHWLLDVIAGVALALAVILILKKYFNRKTLV
ncbi:MAG: phosphatase PAP2 family protein [Candidatus Thermoplasmatota archaeon]